MVWGYVKTEIDSNQFNTPYTVDGKLFDYVLSVWIDLETNTKIGDGNSLILPKGLVKVGDMWVACRYPYPFPKSGVLEEVRMSQSKYAYPVRKIKKVENYGYMLQPQIDYLLNWSFGSYGYQDKEYVGVEPTPTKPDEPPMNTTPSIECYDIVFQAMNGAEFKVGSTLGNRGSNVVFTAKKGVYFIGNCFLAPNYKLGLSKDGVEWFRRNSGKIICVVNTINQSTKIISPLKYWNDFVY